MNPEALPITWVNTEEIAFQLFEKNPNLNPLQIRFTALRDMVLAIPGFTGEKSKCNERILEAIQMAWLEEYRDA